MAHANSATTVSPAGNGKYISSDIFYQHADVIKINRFELSVDEIFLKLFAAVPKWIEILVAAKNAAEKLMAREISGIKKASHFATELRVGERVGFMEIRGKNQREITAGAGDGVLVSVYKRTSSEVVVTTWVNGKTTVGRIYLVFMKLLQKPVATYFLLKAVRTGRL